MSARLLGTLGVASLLAGCTAPVQHPRARREPEGRVISRPIAEAAGRRVIVTDRAWRSAPAGVAPRDATDPALDDSAWPAAQEIPGPHSYGDVYSIEHKLGGPSPARWIWSGGYELQAALRRTLHAPPGLRRAEALLVCDNRAELWVNGEHVATYDTDVGGWGLRAGALLVDVGPWLVEGRNVIVALALNRDGPAGLALELRLDGAPFLPPLEPPFAPAPPGAAAAFAAAAARLDDDAHAAREAAAQELFALVARHGPALAGELDALAAHPSPDARLAACALRRLLRARPLDLGPAPGHEGDPRYALHRFERGAEDVESAWFLGPSQRSLMLRTLLGAHVLALEEEAALVGAARRSLRDGNDAVAERVATLAGLVGLRALAPDLAALLEARPAGRVGALAASALARIGGPEQVPALEAAARSPYLPMARAAARALRELGGR